jgi:hypothetical protein
VVHDPDIRTPRIHHTRQRTHTHTVYGVWVYVGRPGLGGVLLALKASNRPSNCYEELRERATTPIPEAMCLSCRVVQVDVGVPAIAPPSSTLDMWMCSYSIIKPGKLA